MIILALLDQELESDYYLLRLLFLRGLGREQFFVAPWTLAYCVILLLN